MKFKLISYLTLFIGVVSLSTSAIFVKLANAPSAITAFYRLLFVTLILLPVIGLKKSHLDELRAMRKKQLIQGVLSGVLLSIHYVLWFESLNYTSVASSTVIVTLQPLFSIVGCYYVFKERYSRKAVMGCLVAIVGCLIIGWGDFQVSSTALFGDLLAFLAAGVITAYFMIGQHMRKSVSVMPYSFVGYGSSTVVLFIYAINQNQPFFNYSQTAWISFIGLALVSTILGQMSFNWLLKWFSTSVISMCILGEVIGTCGLAYFILNEVISIQQGIGIFIILTGLALFLIEENRKSKDIKANEAFQVIDASH